MVASKTALLLFSSKIKNKAVFTERVLASYQNLFTTFFKKVESGLSSIDNTANPLKDLVKILIRC